MIAALRNWFVGLGRREQLLVTAMLAIAVPLLVWLLIYRPVDQALVAAKERHLLAVDRHARIAMRASALERGAGLASRAPTGELALIVAESAAQAGVPLAANTAQGPARVSISITSGQARAIMKWLQELEARAITIEDLRMAPGADGSIAMSAQLAKGGQ